MKVVPFDTAFIRTPAFPLTKYIDIMSDQDRFLDEFIKNPFFQNALYFASPELYDLIKNEIATSPDSKLSAKLQQTVLKYAIRATSRSTPFGLFAGIGAVTVSDATAIEVGNTNDCMLHARLDVDFLCAVINDLSTNGTLKKYLLFFPNSTLYRLGDHYRTIETRYVNNRRKYELTSFGYNEYLDIVLQTARKGASIDTLAQSIITDEINADEALDFVNEMIDNQLLVNEFEPSTTGPEVEDQLITALQGVIDRNPDAPDLLPAKQLRHRLMAYAAILKNQENFRLSENCIPACRQVIDSMKEIKTDLNDKHAIQVDMKIALSRKSVDPHVIRDIKKGMEILNRFAKRDTDKSMLDRFTEAFMARYELREVPLIEALDVESGIGYGSFSDNKSLETSSLLEDLPFIKPTTPGNAIKWDHLHAFWSGKIMNCIKGNQTVIQLEDDDLEPFKNNESFILCDTFVAGTTLLQTKETGQTVIDLKFLGSLSAGLWTGRFCYVDEDINKLTRQIAEYEQQVNEEYIVAEINHLPYDRLGNVLQRPAFRKYEIPYMAKSSLPEEGRIMIEDLMLSIDGGRLRLRSRSLNKEVLPLLTNAHTYAHNSLPIYHFLGDMQQRDRTHTYSLDLNSCLKIFKFLPRIVYDNIILNVATWFLEKPEIQLITAAKSPIAEVKILLRERNIPRYFLLADSDNQLLIDTDSDQCMELFITEIRNQSSVMITESWLNEFDFVTKNKEGEAFNNEVMFCFKQETNRNNAGTPVTPVVKNATLPIRHFIPGSEWLYYKIYGGYKGLDDLVCQLHEPLQQLSKKGIIKKWFFLRYYDPGAHIRLRILLPNTGLIDEVMAPLTDLMNTFFKDSLIWKVNMDTYQPEYERYGFAGMDDIETVFHEDSDCCLALLSLVNETGDEDLRWLSALYSLESYMSLFGLNEEQKRGFLKDGKNSYAEKVGSIKMTKKGISKKFQLHSTTIQSFLTQSPTNEALASIMNITNKRNNALMPLIAQIKKTAGDRYVEVMSDLIHMNINRMVRTRNLLYEYVIYELLETCYFRNWQQAVFNNKRNKATIQK